MLSFEGNLLTQRWGHKN